MSLVVAETKGPALWLTLNRPEKLNALTAELVDDLMSRLEAAASNDDVRVVVLRGAGRAFSAGYDLAEEVEGDYDTAYRWWQGLEHDVRATMRIWDFPKATIAAVHGYCLAGACEVAMACDITVATEDARFGEPEIRYGSGPVTLLMPYVLGQKKTRELLLTGDLIDAHEALRLGMVNTVVPAAELEEAVEAYVAKIAPTPPAVVQMTKRALNRAYELAGLRHAVETNLDVSAVLNAAETEEQQAFDEIARTEGLKAALAWRDARYPSGDE